MAGFDIPADQGLTLKIGALLGVAGAWARLQVAAAERSPSSASGRRSGCVCACRPC